MYFFRRKNDLRTLFCRKYNQGTLFLLQKGFEHTCFDAKTIHTHFFVAKKFTHTFLSQKRFTRFFCRENNLRTFLSRKRFTLFVWKVFARLKLPSGKFRLFGPLAGTSRKMSYHSSNQRFPDAWEAHKYEWEFSFRLTWTTLSELRKVRRRHEHFLSQPRKRW